MEGWERRHGGESCTAVAMETPLMLSSCCPNTICLEEDFKILFVMLY